MTKKINQAQPEGIVHPAIRPGDIWKDHHGSRVIILSASPLRVEYRRVGYDATCISSPERFKRDFVYVEGITNTVDVGRFLTAADGKEKIRVLREILQERLKK
ncbi:DUF4222 domain-containing protein [Salmonella enterica]|nr:DUF4222 domain-containing protein [Salmonella enterica subsp. diarizonae]EGV3635706.1 DUF4222 domain-containing protein [Salmonella enterica]EKL0444793.1 DUF4222 domain-containing protein [Salmonella enterica]HCM1888534.1 DUF4222 domain-containing protein [Salmonella enterica subsp. diarizonae serovar 57:c:z]